MKRRPQELTDAVLALYGTVPAKEIASKFNIPVYTVYNIYHSSPNKAHKKQIPVALRRTSLPEYLHLNRKILSSDVEEIRRLRNSGMTLKQIADHFLVSIFAIRYHLSDEVRNRNIYHPRKPVTKTKEQMREASRSYYHRKKEYLLSICCKDN